jgi:pyruvate formate-lyase activating enzyme-like uncharacterized protein
MDGEESNNIAMNTLQDALIAKFNRQLELSRYSDKYKLSLGGGVAHIGPIHITCKYCYSGKHLVFVYEDTHLPSVCNRKCLYCFDVIQQFDSKFEPIEDYALSAEWKNRKIFDYLHLQKHYDIADYTIIYNHYRHGEPLLYIGMIEAAQNFYISELEPKVTHRRGYAKVYTNGTLLSDEYIDRLAAIRIDDLRVNVAADGFSDKVYKSMEKAAKVIDSVSIEIAVWPKNRKKLFEMLQISEEIDVHHINLCQVKIQDDKTLRAIQKSDPTATLYAGDSRHVMLDDDGLVEEMMKEVIDRNYSFHVLDCNCVTQARNAPNAMSNRFNDQSFDDDDLYYFPPK